MGRADFLKLGDWNATCSMCGFKFKASELTKNWQGQYRCRSCQESRHPQEFVRALAEKETPEWVQHPSDVMLPQCNLNGRCAIPDVGTPDCALPDWIETYDPTAPGG